MTDFLKTTREGGALIITLNRPKAINALDPHMMAGIADALEEATFDPDVKLVVIEGAGEKGFCAGGDVRHVRQWILDSKIDEAFAFFELEYGVNQTIAQFDKPIVSLMHGFTMGGGIGVGSHARYRFGTQSAKFAMPEAAIGFFADVGARMLLAEADFDAALMFLLCGDPHDVHAAVALNLCDTVVADSALPTLRAAVIDAAAAEDADLALYEIADRFGMPAAEADTVAFDADAFCAREIDEVVADLTDETALVKWVGDDALAKLISSRCPTTHLISIVSLKSARENQSLQDYCDRDIANLFAQEIELAKLVVLRPDFVEGVRAVLMDKGSNAKWVDLNIENGAANLMKSLTKILDLSE